MGFGGGWGSLSRALPARLMVVARWVLGQDGFWGRLGLAVPRAACKAAPKAFAWGAPGHRNPLEINGIPKKSFGNQWNPNAFPSIWPGKGVPLRKNIGVWEFLHFRDFFTRIASRRPTLASFGQFWVKV